MAPWDQVLSSLSRAASSPSASSSARRWEGTRVGRIDKDLYGEIAFMSILLVLMFTYLWANTMKYFRTKKTLGGIAGECLKTRDSKAEEPEGKKEGGKGTAKVDEEDAKDATPRKKDKEV